MSMYTRRILLSVLLGFSSVLFAADCSVQFIGHWSLKPEQSEIHPGSQWVTEELDIRLVGRLLELTESSHLAKTKT
jgi:hypothetical protein